MKVVTEDSDMYLSNSPSCVSEFVLRLSHTGVQILDRFIYVHARPASLTCSASSPGKREDGQYKCHFFFSECTDQIHTSASHSPLVVQITIFGQQKPFYFALDPEIEQFSSLPEDLHSGRDLYLTYSMGLLSMLFSNRLFCESGRERRFDTMSHCFLAKKKKKVKRKGEHLHEEPEPELLQEPQTMETISYNKSENINLSWQGKYMVTLCNTFLLKSASLLNFLNEHEVRSFIFHNLEKTENCEFFSGNMLNSSHCKESKS